MKSRNIKFINNWLKDNFGQDIKGRPFYRIVWSEDQLEKRKGEFHIYSGPIFVRRFFGVMEQKKYQYHPNWKDRWVLERLDFTHNPELVEEGGHYEPLYVFYDANGDYLKPTLKAVQFFMHHLLMRKPWRTDKDKWEELNEQEKQEYNEEAEYFYGCLDDEFGGDIASAIRAGEGVVVPGAIHLPDGGVHLFNRGSNGRDSHNAASVSSQRQEAGAES